MAPDVSKAAAETTVLRFGGEEEDGSTLHELRAAHVAEVLQGLVELASDFAKAGAFGENRTGSEVLVRPAREGSFLIEVIRFVQDNAEAEALGLPSLGTVIWWATRSIRAEVSNFEGLPNGNVKVTFQDDTVQEIPRAAWNELNTRKKKRKKQLRQIMAPLSDARVASLEVGPPPTDADGDPEPDRLTLRRADYDAVRPDDDEVEEASTTFQTEAQMSAVDFDNPAKWRIKTPQVTRKAVVEDPEFLGRIANGLGIRKTDIFNLTVREDTVTKDGRTTRTWTVIKVESFRRAAHDDDA